MSYDHEHAAMLATADPAGYDPASRTYSRCFPDVGEAFEAVRELEAAGNRGWISHRPDRYALTVPTARRNRLRD
jgi:hypothetical protein